jgi:hypothetical protein
MNTKKGQFEPAEVGKLFAKHFSAQQNKNKKQNVGQASPANLDS